MFDIIGIGALNLDYIATRKKLVNLDSKIKSELASKFEYGIENHVDKDEIELTLSQMGTTPFETFLGGSAFNVISTISSINPGFNIGYVGVSGNTDFTDLNFIDEFNRCRVDISYVENSLEKCGICISYISEGERSLLTWPGANVEVAKYLDENFENIEKYLSNSKIIHVTSFFDENTPKILLKLLKAVKNKNPWIKISFDPGHEWIVHLTNEIKGILSLTDYLFLNNREFEILGHHRPGSTDINLVRRIFHFCSERTLLIILKRYDSIKLFYRIHGRLISFRYSNIILPSESIEDATGAGDVFAGGFLSAMLIPGMEFRHGVELGLRLVRSKLLVAGAKSFNTFPAIFSGLINDISSANITNNYKSFSSEQPCCVFIGHGSSPIWAIVERHLREELAVPCKSYESNSHTSQSIVNILSEFLDTCNFAIMILTADDDMQNGVKRARQNVLHEIGLFQGRYGFNKVVILMQKGVEKFSNSDGFQYIEFSNQNIEYTFYELDRTLKREKICS